MKNTVKINENTLRKIVAESVKKSLSEIINPFDDGFGGVDTAMAASYSNKNIGDAWLKKSGMRRDMLQGGKPVPNNKEEENETKINESCSYKINESTLSRIITKSVKKVLNEEQGWDGVLSGGKVLDRNIKNGNIYVDMKLMCEFLQKYVMPNGEEQDGKFIYRGDAVDVTEINRSIHEAMRYLYNIVKQFGY